MNYLDLRNAAIAYSDRYDKEVSDNIDIYILMTEARINRLLKTREQSNRAFLYTIVDKEFYALPPDWAGMRAMYLVEPDPNTSPNSTVKFVLLDPVSFQSTKHQDPGGKFFYCIIANQIQIYPTIDVGFSIEMIYYQKVPNLNPTDDVTSTNWLSESHPDIYLAGMTAEISLFAKDYDAAQSWYDRLKAAVDELDNVDWIERWSGDPLQTRAEQ
jgi:hypothetical protein